MLDDNELHRGFDAGNFANAYETDRYDRAIGGQEDESPEYQAAFTLGFFASYEEHERYEHADAYGEALASPAGQRCLQLGFIEP